MTENTNVARFAGVSQDEVDGFVLAEDLQDGKLTKDTRRLLDTEHKDTTAPEQPPVKSSPASAESKSHASSPGAAAQPGLSVDEVDSRGVGSGVPRSDDEVPFVDEVEAREASPHSQ